MVHLRLGLPVLVTIASLSAPLAAQPKATPAGPLPVMPIRPVSPAVLARFKATKAKLDPAKEAATFSVRGTTTFVRVKNGRSYPLEPASFSQITSTTPPPPELSKYKPWYERVSLEPLKDPPQVIAVKQDHTARQTPVKDQKGRGSCVAFSVAGGMESYLSWKKSLQADISEEHMFKLFKDSKGANCNDYGFSFTPATEVLTGKRVCSESQLPYADPSQCVIPTACSSGASFSLERWFIIKSAASTEAPGFEVTNTKLLESILDMGYDISFASGVAGSGWSDSAAETGVIDVELKADGTPADSRGGHATLLVGYDRPGGYFIMKNSWGADWGRAGYARVSYDYVQTYATGALVILEAARTLPVVSTQSNTLPKAVVR